VLINQFFSINITTAYWTLTNFSFVSNWSNWCGQIVWSKQNVVYVSEIWRIISVVLWQWKWFN